MSGSWTLHEDLSEMAYVLTHPDGKRRAWFSLHDFREPIMANRIGGVGKDPFAELARFIQDYGLRPYKVEGDFRELSRDGLIADLRRQESTALVVVDITS